MSNWYTTLQYRLDRVEFDTMTKESSFGQKMKDYGKGFALSLPALALVAPFTMQNPKGQRPPQSPPAMVSPSTDHPVEWSQLVGQESSDPEVAPEEVKTTTPTSTESPSQKPATTVDGHIREYIAVHEGNRSKVYDDGVGNKTIGIGHLIKPTDKPLFAKLFGNNVDFDKLYSGAASLTSDQINTLFDYDVKKHLDRAESIVPSYDSYPVYVQAALLDAVYRGDLGPKTSALINAGKWAEASVEYLNHNQYKNRVSLGIAGIGPRMEGNAAIFKKYSEELSAKAKK